MRLSRHNVVSRALSATIFIKGFAGGDHTSFCTSTNVLLKRNFAVRRTLALLVRRGRKVRTNVLATLESEVVNKRGLSTTVTTLSKSVPNFRRTTLRATRRDNSRSGLLVHLTRFVRQSHRVERHIHSTLICPATILALTFFLLVLVVFMVLPGTRSVFPTNGNKSTLTVTGTTPVILNVLFISVTTLILSFSFVTTHTQEDGGSTGQCRRMLLHLPLIQGLVPLL